MDQQNDDQLIFGFPEEWADFRRRHPLFLERFPHIAEATQAAFCRVMTQSEQVERFVMLYGRLCVEDFYEIMLCCGNGYRMAATKLLRALYEKAVTLDYLNDHPEEIDAFFNYHHVAWHKLITSVIDVFGTSAISSEIQEETTKNFQRVKDQFMVTACEKCGTKRVHHTWTKLHVAAMSKRTRILGKLIQSGYYLPMRHTHSSVAALIERLENNAEGFGFNPNSQRREADAALKTAHTILLEILYIQQKRFHIEGFEQLLDQCNQDWKEINGVEDDGI
jgi:hypothetical protein